MSKIKLGEVKEFEWDEANIEHIAKHNVIPREAEEVFFDKNNALNEDIKHSTTEVRFLIIGKTKKGRLLYQVFTIRGGKMSKALLRIRVISSRNINKKEVGLYEEETSGS